MRIIEHNRAYPIFVCPNYHNKIIPPAKVCHPNKKLKLKIFPENLVCIIIYLATTISALQ